MLLMLLMDFCVLLACSLSVQVNVLVDAHGFSALSLHVHYLYRLMFLMLLRDFLLSPFMFTIYTG